MSNSDSFMGQRQVLLVGLGGVGGRIVNNLMRNLPKENQKHTQAIAIDTDIRDMNRLDCIPKDHRIVLASSPSSGNSMTIGNYLQKNPGARDWFVTEGHAFGALKSRSTKDGAKQIRMVSRLALSASAKYYGLDRKIASIVSKLCASDGSVVRDNLLVMVVCSIAGGTGAGTVLQFPMYLEEILSNYYNRDEISIQCAMLLPNLFKQTQADGNYFKGKVNGYSVIRELQSLNTNKLKRFEYMKDYVEISEEDTRSNAPYSYVLLFDDSTSTGAAINGATDTVHVPNVTKCLYEYIFGAAADRCKSQLDNTLDKIYSTENRAIFRAVGSADLVFPDHLYKHYAVSNWILRAVSEEWMKPGEQAQKNYLEQKKRARDEGKALPGKMSYRKAFINVINDQNICPGVFYSEIRRQLYKNAQNKVKPLADIYYESLFKKALEEMKSNKYNYTRSFNNLSEGLKGESNNTHESSFVGLENGFNEFLDNMSNLVDSFMRPSDSLTNKFLVKNNNDLCLYTFIRKNSLHPLALRTFLYQLEGKLCAESNKSIPVHTSDQVVNAVKQVSKKKDRPAAVKAQMDLFAAPYESRVNQDLANRLLVYVRELITEVESFFEDLNVVKTKFESISTNCMSNLDTYENEIKEVIGSKEGMIACWNDVKDSLTEGDDSDEDVIDNALSEEINKMIYIAYYNWVSSSGDVSDDEDVFRPKTKYHEIVTSHLFKNFNKRINEQHSKSFPADIIKAAIFETGVRKAYEIQSSQNPKFKPEKFAYSVAQSELDFAGASFKKDVADYLNSRLEKLVTKANPMCGPVDTDQFEGRALIFNKDILEVSYEGSDGPNADINIKTVSTHFIPGVETSEVGSAIVQIEPVDNISKHRMCCFSYSGGLEPCNFENLQDPVSGTFDSQNGRCYYNAYREYINKVMNTTTDNLTPHLHKKWHLAGYLNDISDGHTDSVNYHAAQAFVYGFLFNNVIRIDKGGYIKFGISGSKHFTDMPGAVNGIFTYAPMTEVEHARFESSKNATDRILYEVFQYLRNVPELRTRIINYGKELLEQAKANSTGAVFKYSIDPELCADQVYKTIIDVMDGFYQHARFTDLHDGMNSDLKILGNMFDILADTAIDLCASLYATSKLRLEKFKVYVDKLYECANCDDPTATASDDLFTLDTIETSSPSSTSPFSANGDLNSVAMMGRMEAYLNKG